jgi:RHS repeat-associated protein
VASLIYDPVGNLVSQKGGTLGAEVTYAWDAANRLIKISKPGAVTEFVYDGLSRRVAEKFNGTVIKRWIWFNGDAQPAEERDASNAVTRRFYADMGEQIGGINYYYTVDHLGSVRELTDSTGAVRARYAYDPYGRRTKVSGDLEASFGYTGYYQHTPSGLSLALYRAYDARLGRFISRDPIEENGGVNLYAYVYSSPLNSIDPLGLVDLNLFGTKDPLNELAQHTEDSASEISVGGHGAIGGGEMFAPSGVPQDIKDLASKIKALPKYKAGVPVKLLVCEAGKDPGDGRGSVGAQLAKALGGANPVIANPDPIIYSRPLIDFKGTYGFGPTFQIPFTTTTITPENGSPWKKY